MRWLLLALALSGCAGMEPAPVARSEAEREYFLISNGWHTALVLPRRAIPPDTLRVAREFTDGRFLVIGWGDLGFYVNQSHSPWTILRAFFVPSASALHVIPVRDPIAQRFSHSEVLRLCVSREQFENLCRALDQEFATRDGRIVRICDGYFPASAFYLGRGSYSFRNTCNVWTARMMRAGGERVRPGTALVADDLMWQARKNAVRLNALSRPRDGF